jgi:hypothetical protein
MRNVIVRGRGEGKTMECVRLSSREWYYIVCPTHKDARRIYEEARFHCYDIPFPITFAELMRGDFSKKNIKGFIIDDVDRMIESLCRNVPLVGISLWNGIE